MSLLEVVGVQLLKSKVGVPGEDDCLLHLSSFGRGDSVAGKNAEDEVSRHEEQLGFELGDGDLLTKFEAASNLSASFSSLAWVLGRKQVADDTDCCFRCRR